MKWNLSADRPIYAQLIEQITSAIVAGEYQPREKLPSVRDLAEEAAVNPNTMQKALAELERSGLVYTQRTAGRYITEDKAMLKKIKEDIALTQIHQFLEQMGRLGLTPQEIAALVAREASAGPA
ncbi:MAG: GntR family transcriptional regulator [Oscillospiraceae bacterium]|jgi:GntR family transcriptional regulator|nr:GntR family transcriptional regulator [Oscillospiraceae bacterium]